MACTPYRTGFLRCMQRLACGMTGYAADSKGLRGENKRKCMPSIVAERGPIQAGGHPVPCQLHTENNSAGQSSQQGAKFESSTGSHKGKLASQDVLRWTALDLLDDYRSASEWLLCLQLSKFQMTSCLHKHANQDRR